MSTRKTPSTTTRKVPAVSELPVTRSMLYGVRDELAARIDETNARIDETNARIDQLGARFDQLGARIDQIDASTRASMRRMETLIEEQEARNRVVLEVVQGHNARFERIEARLDETQSMIVEILDIVRGRAR